MNKIKNILLLFTLSLLVLTFFSCQTSALNSINADFPKSEYVTFLGSGYSLSIAEQNAKENLASYFGFDTTVSGNLDSQEIGADATYDAAFNEDRVTTNRVGIRCVSIERTFEEKGIYYALAVMNRQEAIDTYTDLLAPKVPFINEFYSVLKSRERYDLNDLTIASVLLRETVAFFNNLKILNRLVPDTAKTFQNQIHSIEDIHVLIKDIQNQLPFSVSIEGRGRGRSEINECIVSFLENRGFKVVEGENGKYTVDVNYELVPVVIKDSNKFFYKYSITIKVVEKETGLDIITVSATAREGHETADLARDRSIERMVEVISGDLTASFDSQIGVLN